MLASLFGGGGEPVSRNPMEALFNLPQERVISEFMCAKKRRRGGQLLYHGRLYVSQNYVCWRAKTITGATKDVVLHLGDLVHMSKSRHAMINPAIRIVARHKRYLFTSFFPFTMRDHACTIIAGQWALYDAAAVIQRKFRAHLSATGRTSKAKRFPFKILYKPAAILDEATGVARMSSQNDSVTDFGGDNDSSSGGGGGGQSAAEVADVADYDILSDLQNGVQGLDELPFKHIIKTFEVPTTVKQAYSILFSDSSPFTETVHLANQEATKVTIGKWRPSASADEPNVKQATPAASTTAGGRSREITFVQKIDNPLSPIKQGRGFWFQRIGWLSSGVLVYQTLSTIKDVPFGESWAIQKKWIVRPVGDAGIDSPVCQVTCSIECIFYKRMLWSGKMESETISTATKDYQLLATKIVSFVQAAEGRPAMVRFRSAPEAPRAAPPPAARAGETEEQMLRRRLTEAEAALQQGAAVKVGALSGGWLGGLLGGSKAPDFILRATLDPQSEKWKWQVSGDDVEKEGKTRVVAWPAGAAAPSA